jgi:cell wall-associated NlpC family hydrolase
MKVITTPQNIRNRVVSEARSFVGVDFRHQGRSRQGVDCAGLLYCVFDRIVGLNGNYNQYPNGLKSGMVFRKMKDYGDRISQKDAGPGDVVLMNFHGSSTHLGILTECGVIHADGPLGKVVEHSVNESFVIYNGRIVAYFRIKGVPPWRG